MTIKYFAPLTAAAGFLFIAAPSAQAATLSSPASGLTINVDETTGVYSVRAAKTGWNFQGGVGNSISKVGTFKGSDKLGSYQEIRLQWTDDTPWNGSIRSYDSRPLVSFTIGNTRAALGPTPDFPNFTSFPQKLRNLSFNDSVFSPPAFRLQQTSTPWFFFDDNGETAVISPASNFLVSQMHGDGIEILGSGLNHQVSQLPAGFKHTTFMLVDSGVVNTFRKWGKALTDLSGKPKTTDNADDLIKYLGYWTDNGGHYYYNYDKNLGYAGTLLALKKQYDQKKIPIRYMQLDSWWYQKSLRNPNGTIGGTTKNADFPKGTWNAYGGTLDYSASPELFPKGLKSFNQELGLPFIVHARWLDPTGPYRKNYKVSGVSPIDAKWWNERMAYLKANGVITYEQDWLNEIYNHTPLMSRDINVGPAFADNMARSAQQNGITLQYCMATSRFFLQGSNYPNLTTIRTSEDRFERNKWNHFLYTSLLADSLNIRPWTDVFNSTESGNLTIAALSAGPVGVGDEIGKESPDALLSTSRADGVLIKPSAPLVPTEASILADARSEKKPLVSATYTDNGQRVAYAFAYSRRDDSSNYSFSPASLGLSGTVYAYDITAKTAEKLDAASPLAGSLGQQAWKAFLIAPVGSSGVAFMGDTNKIVGTGRQRIASVRDEAGLLTANVVLAASEESVSLHGYSATRPTVTSIDGVVSTVDYDAASQHFTVKVAPADGARTTNDDGDAVHKITVAIRS
jgi:hypothetical protein